MHAQQVMRLALLCRQQRFQVGFGGFHRHLRKRTAAQLVQSPVRVEPAYSRLIRFEPFSHADHFVDLEAEVAQAPQEGMECGFQRRTGVDFLV